MANDKNPYAGKNKTPAGILPPDHAKRHGLTSTMYLAGDPSYKKIYRHNRKGKKLFEQVKTYRTLAHKVVEPRLSNSLRLAVHYLLEPMARSSGYVAHTSAADNDDSTASVQAPLKV